MARPKKDIDRADFESLCLIQCSLEEITAFFDNKLGGCSKDTIERWCKREYGMHFAEISKIKRQLGKISLRRWQFEKARKLDTNMLKFLGKNYLGQQEFPEVEPPEDESITFINDIPKVD